MAITQISICNSALVKIGADIISSITQETKSARVLNAVYEQVLKEVLRARNWNFAIKRDSLTPTATTPEYEYDYEFNLPSDCLILLDTEEEFFDEEEYSVEGRKVYSNHNPLNIRYIYYNTDASSYDPMFAEALSWRLAQTAAYALTQSSTLEEQCKKRYEEALSQAAYRDGSEGTLKVFTADIWTNARRS